LAVQRFNYADEFGEGLVLCHPELDQHEQHLKVQVSEFVVGVVFVEKLLLNFVENRGEDIFLLEA